MSQIKCFLTNIEDNKIKLHLQNQLEVKLGRCPQTNIRDKRCSKNQVSLCADYSTGSVSVQHLGGNPSSAKGIILRNTACLLNHGDILEFLVGEHRFRVEFDPMPEKFQKRKTDINQIEDEEHSDTKRACKEEIINKGAEPCKNKIWERIDDGKLYVFTAAGVKSSSKIAAYDMDGTIILTKSGRVFPKDNDDWKIANGSVKKKLEKYFTDGYKLVVLTNQAGIGRGKTNINEFKSKIESIVSALSLPIQVFISTTNSIYRKPVPGMWTFLESNKNDGIKIDMKSSFYVGDAAGRIMNWKPGKKKDFSSADRLLALNLKLKFYTPEENFLNERPGKFALPLFNPAALAENMPVSDGDIISKIKEVIIMVGSPGSGKSHFAQKHLVSAGYAHINRDSLGTWQKCVAAMEAALASGRSVVIDNTNPDQESRRRFIERSTVPCRCFVMTTTIDHIRHNNRFRELTDPKHIPVNDMIINSYKNKFEPPSLDEGFKEIVNVNFVPSFSDSKLQKLYQMYLLEK